MTSEMATFDSIASSYDRLWTESTVGVVQRRAVWRVIDALFAPGDKVLDLGCGTGADAVHLHERGVRVHGIDSSSAMVSIARKKGVDAIRGDLDDLTFLTGRFDGAISNFGALNCMKEIKPIAKALVRLVRPGGYVALCFLGRFCFWELAYYLGRGEIQKAVRRISGRAKASLASTVFYPSEHRILHAFRNGFLLVARRGIGVTVPPSYVRFVSRPALDRLAAADDVVAALPLLRSLADHRLYVWRRI